MATKDQNLRMPISLRTINRKPSDGLQDGELLDLINLRFSNGSMRPVPQKVQLTGTLPQFKVLYKHVISETVFAYWGIVSDHLAYSVYENNLPVLENLTFMDLLGYEDMKFGYLGNSLLVSVIGMEKTFVMLFNPDTQTYKLFDKLLPELPFVGYRVLPSVDDDETGGSSIEFPKETTVEYEWDFLDNAVAGVAQDIAARKYKKGHLIGRYLIRTAWELFDGTIIMHSAPQFIDTSRMYGQIVFNRDHISDTDDGTWSVVFQCLYLQYILNISSGDLTALKTQYEGVIKSLNFYITNHGTLKKMNCMTYGAEDFDTGLVDIFDYKEMIPWIEKEMLYFEYKKVDLKSLQADAWTSGKIDDASTISSGVTLTPVPLSIHRPFGKSLFSYNQRIFFGNIKNTLYPGTPLYGQLTGVGPWWCTGPTYYIGFSYDLDTSDGMRRVFSGWQSCNLYRGTSADSAVNADIHDATHIGKTGKTWTTNQWAGYTVAITSGTGVNQVRTIVSNTATTLTISGTWSPEPENDSDFDILTANYFQFVLYNVIGYPDQRAKEFRIWHKDGGGTIRLLKEIVMYPVYGMNFSFVFPPLTGWELYNSGALIRQPTSLWTVQPINETPFYYDADRIQACEFQNPYYYPAANSYRVDGFVLGMATNTIAFLETGQFGEFPIFAFTTKGIWALNIGTGEVLIDSIRPLSGTICTNEKSILGIDGGVIFMSNEGLMILAGAQPVGISDMVIGTPVSPLSGLLEYEKVIDNPNTYQPVDYAETVDFEEYAEGAEVAFVNINTAHGLEKEIIISNPDYDYSYCYNVVGKFWYRITSSWDTFIHDFPFTYGTKYVAPNYLMYDMTKEVLNTDAIMVHAETRPIRFGEQISFKKIHRSLLYGFINPETEHPFTFYLFGSADGQHWFVQNASNVIVPGESVAMGRSTFSCRMYIFVLGGSVLNDSYLQALICDVEKRYNQKLQ